MNDLMNRPGLTSLQQDAWRRPFLDGARHNEPRVDEPREGWRVGLSVNL